ncbi:hypothetical protein COV49_02120 [Candidatus Falkowbacteria bacterium CG11_big_fil_rev_8_21_14_0_20_39_10]|uniref:Uncharacterized protein n=1 Tax=Candidatus Falkowbacteria bacterium CG11_big_fil_rev_8_21_14_0_20_39_10 TaxID=1974570 RepID=A0A2M6K9F3_9BACT|nr:MAG: hypothetical protein COV49_02120 [Candidatus Falkowbacteria bacterium CG11_big_fil_rev_8_21_14_0_20_39_10]
MKQLGGVQIKILKDDNGKLYRQTVIDAGDTEKNYGTVLLPPKIADATQNVLNEAQHRIFEIFTDCVAGN